MNTEVVSRTGTLPGNLVTAVHPTEALEIAVEQVLAAVRPAVLTDPLSGALRAEESLRSDPFVKTLEQTFGARLIPNSVRPVDGEAR